MQTKRTASTGSVTSQLQVLIVNTEILVVNSIDIHALQFLSFCLPYEKSEISGMQTILRV